MTQHMHREQGGDATPGRLVAQFSILRPTFLFKEAPNILHIHLPVVRLCINEDGPRASIADRIGGCDEGERRDQDFFVRLHSGDEQRSMQCRSAIHRRHTEARADAIRDHAFKLIDITPN